MATLLCQVESCLNSRPLCPLTADVDDYSALTPGHFLIGDQLCSVPEPNILPVSDNRLTRWQLVQKIHQHFWKRWSSEYLNILQRRNKWHQIQNDIKVGDMVLVRDDRYPPASWPLGRVTQIQPGADARVRVISIKCQNSIIKRPITKVCVLPINN